LTRPEEVFKMHITMIFSALLLLLPSVLISQVQGAPTDHSDCCLEKRVGDIEYSLVDVGSSSSPVPEQCLNDCVYSVTGTSEPRFCFARGELPVECEDDGFGSGYGYGGGNSSVSISVVVRDATTNEDVSDAFVEFHLGELFLTTFTDEFGLAVFTFSLNDVVVPEEGVMAFVNISKDGFFSYSYERMIFSYAIEEFDWEVAIALSPSLAENEMRIVLSWETSQDLDIYALQMDKATGDIVCKTYWLNMDGCEGIVLDVDSRHGENGSETITWNEGSADPYKYLLYVHDYSQLGFSESEARISFYGEQVVKMEVEDGNNEDRYWMLGSFEPSEGVSLFSIDGEFQTDNPDTSARSEAVARKP